MTELKDLDLSSGGATGKPGGASGSIWDGLFGANGSLGTGSMEQAKKSAGALVESAKNGGFTVTKESAEHLLKALRNSLKDIEEAEATLRNFEQEQNSETMTTVS